MIKIVYLISSLKKNGPNNVLKSMILGIDKSKYQVYLVSFLSDDDPNYVNELKKMNFNVFQINLKNKIDILFKGKKQLKKILCMIKPNIIHSHGILPDLVNGSIKTKDIIKITTLHDNMFEDYIYCFGRLKGLFFIKMHLHYLKKMNKCICCSESSFIVLKEYLNNVTYVRNAVYKSPIDYEQYLEFRKNIRAKYNISNSSVVYIYAGVISKLKNIEKMVTFFDKSLSKNEYLLILGEGNMKKRLEESNKNKNIIFCGHITNVSEFLCAADIYTSFSSSEGFSISILEALEKYNLLLLSNIPSHKEVVNIDRKINIGENFDDINFFDKKEKLKKLLKKFNKEDYDNLLINELSIYVMMDRYCNIYEKEIKKRGWEV